MLKIERNVADFLADNVMLNPVSSVQIHSLKNLTVLLLQTFFPNLHNWTVINRKVTYSYRKVIKFCTAFSHGFFFLL